MYILCDTKNRFLKVFEAESEKVTVKDAAGNTVSTPLLLAKDAGNGRKELLLDGTQLSFWTLEDPVLYTLESGKEKERFGFSSLSTFRNECMLLNDTPIYLRGYIRGIIAHDHPNMTGGTEKDAAYKNIRQAKKYGFNLVRFHSTIPSEAFVEAADELGLLIHMEIGFAYDYDKDGNKKNLSMNNTAWRETILKYRNHPSVCIFCIGNEMHNAGRYPEVRAMYEEGKLLAPGKLVMDNSGWGEFDRESADIYSQHIAYFFPAGRHKNMFLEDDCWRLNGNVKNTPMEGDKDLPASRSSFRQEAVPLKPTLSHEAVHYIELPDYDLLAEKFDKFAAKVGPEYLEKNGIKKPRFMTELPALIRAKGLLEDMGDRIKCTEEFKMMAVKCFLEQLRLSPLCGYEMLQFADCFKYENKNGIVDCFDDDKYIPAEWMRQFNSDLVFLADFPKRCFYGKEELSFTVHASSFIREKTLRGRLRVTLTLDEEELLCDLPDVALAGGLQKIAELCYRRKEDVKETREAQIALSFLTEKGEFTNSWRIWFYPEAGELKNSFEMDFASGVLQNYFAGSKEKPLKKGVFLTDKLNDTLFEKLADGVDTLLIYKRNSPENILEFPGTIERFKPCIWDRGSNLGGVLADDSLRKVLGPGKYYNFNMQDLLEGGSKVCCDTFRDKIRKLEFSVDKPVRDRMAGIVLGSKDFIPEATLRDFSHLFSIRCKNGEKEAILCVVTYNMEVDSPGARNLFGYLLSGERLPDSRIPWDLADFKETLCRLNKAGFRQEDVMNRFWEMDNKRVEDKLFWEEAGVDLAKLGRK